MPEVIPDTCVARVCDVVVPSPSCPYSLRPEHLTFPVLTCNAQLCRYPPAIITSTPEGDAVAGVLVGVLVGVFVGVPVGVFVGVSVGVSVAVWVGVVVGVSVGVEVTVAVGVAVGVVVGVFVGVLVGVEVKVAVRAMVGVDAGVASSSESSAGEPASGARKTPDTSVLLTRSFLKPFRILAAVLP